MFGNNGWINLLDFCRNTPWFCVTLVLSCVLRWTLVQKQVGNPLKRWPCVICHKSLDRWTRLLSCSLEQETDSCLEIPFVQWDLSVVFRWVKVKVALDTDWIWTFSNMPHGNKSCFKQQYIKSRPALLWFKIFWMNFRCFKHLQYYNILHTCTVVSWLSLSPHSKWAVGSIPGRGGPSVWSLHVLPVAAWVPSWFSRFLPQSKDMQLRLIDL